MRSFASLYHSNPTIYQVELTPSAVQDIQVGCRQVFLFWPKLDTLNVHKQKRSRSQKPNEGLVRIHPLVCKTLCRQV